MTPILPRSLAATAAFAILVSALVVLPGPQGSAQPKGAPDAEPAAGEMSARILNCRRCHLNPLPEDRANGTTDFIKLTESQTWHDLDLHSLAHAHIRPSETGGPGGKPNLAWEMQQVLAPHRPEGYRVDRAAECLTCHATDLTAHRNPHVPLAEKKFDDFDWKSGVTCEACHGKADDWIGPHFSADWRKVSPEDKAKRGLVDLRDPYTRAATCAACHVGSKAEGRFVTHEMYAAGHPPLPPFELVTYAADAPRHYYTHRENKALAAMDADTAWKNFHYRKDECAEARSLAVGTVAGFEATMQLLADDAAATAKTGELLDFAHFDCYACHHDLKVPSWRQQRGYRGTPGRPTMKPWATETLQAVLQHAQGASGINTEKVTKTAADVRAGLVALNKAYDAKPFGQTDEIAKLAGGLVGPCRGLRDELAPLVYDPAQTEALYRLLADRLRKADGKPGPDGLYLDHDTAQQTVWGLRALREELVASKKQGFAADPKAEAELDKITALHVRGPKREPVAGERNRDRMQRIGAFDPGVFLPKAQEWLK
jgi:hypothetical protein